MNHNSEKLKDNPRLHFAYMNWQNMDSGKKEAILHKADKILTDLDSGLL